VAGGAGPSAVSVAARLNNVQYSVLRCSLHPARLRSATLGPAIRNRLLALASSRPTTRPPEAPPEEIAEAGQGTDSGGSVYLRKKPAAHSAAKSRTSRAFRESTCAQIISQGEQNQHAWESRI